MLITVIMYIGIIANQYKEWHMLPQYQRGYDTAVIWWTKKSPVKKQLSCAADNMSSGTQYGIGALTDIDAEYDNTIEDFAVQHTQPSRPPRGIYHQAFPEYNNSYIIRKR